MSRPAPDVWPRPWAGKKEFERVTLIPRGGETPGPGHDETVAGAPKPTVERQRQPLQIVVGDENADANAPAGPSAAAVEWQPTPESVRALFPELGAAPLSANAAIAYVRALVAAWRSLNADAGSSPRARLAAFARHLPPSAESDVVARVNALFPMGAFASFDDVFGVLPPGLRKGELRGDAERWALVLANLGRALLAYSKSVFDVEAFLLMGHRVERKSGAGRRNSAAPVLTAVVFAGIVHNEAAVPAIYAEAKTTRIKIQMFLGGHEPPEEPPEEPPPPTTPVMERWRSDLAQIRSMPMEFGLAGGEVPELPKAKVDDHWYNFAFRADVERMTFGAALRPMVHPRLLEMATGGPLPPSARLRICLLYTSDAADD